jgi:hypothetical protein
MNDSQAQIRWLAAVLVVLVVGIGPVVAGLAFSEEPEVFTIYDARGQAEIVTTMQKDLVAKLGRKAIFLVGAEGVGCESDENLCPDLDDETVVDVPVSAAVDIENVLASMGNTYNFDVVDEPRGARKASLPGEDFSVKAALLTGVLFLVGTLLAIAALAGRRTERVPSSAGYPGRPLPPQDYQEYDSRTFTVTPQEPVIPAKPVTPARPVTPAKPVAPAVRLADLPEIHDVAHAHGATATGRSHIDDAGGYIALGDVLVWATPVAPDGAITAYPDDDVHVTAAARQAPLTPPQYGGLQP